MDTFRNGSGRLYASTSLSFARRLRRLFSVKTQKLGDGFFGPADTHGSWTASPLHIAPLLRRYYLRTCVLVDVLVSERVADQIIPAIDKKICPARGRRRALREEMVEAQPPESLARRLN